MKSNQQWIAGALLLIVACTTNTRGVGGERKPGAACDHDDECASNACTLGSCDPTTTTSDGIDVDAAADSGVAPECSRFPFADSRNTCADCAKFGAGYQCAYWNDDVPYCYFPCKSDADCACDSFAPYCRPTSLQPDLSTNVGTVCGRTP